MFCQRCRLVIHRKKVTGGGHSRWGSKRGRGELRGTQNKDGEIIIMLNIENKIADLAEWQWSIANGRSFWH